MPSETFVFAVLTIGVVMIVAHLVRLLRTAILHKTLREAISRDNASLGPLLAEGIEPAAPAYNDGRNGILLIALALAMAAFALIQGDPDDIRNLGGAAVFPGFAGLALLGRAWWQQRQG